MLSRQALLRSARTAAPQRAVASQMRFYAAPAADNARPPNAVYGLDGTYASALVRPPPSHHPLWPSSSSGDHTCDRLGPSSRSLPRRSLPRRSNRRLTARNIQYTAAVKTSTLEPTAKAVASLGALMGRDVKLAKVLETPTLSAADKSAIVAELQKSAGGAAVGDTVKHFLAALAENNRLGLLEGVCAKFGELMSAARGEVEVTVTSAQVRELSLFRGPTTTQPC